ncbi:gpW family head-tail joining protein [Enterobacter hormaechei]|uniref:gpW family head-tail joining protein n=1 Tax=Enterobacter hormaechei TaxID=158836 RepID=UPI003D35B7AA
MSILTSFTCDQLREMLASALAALHALNTGRQVAEVVDQNGERVKFTAASASRLAIYIDQLQSALAEKGCDGATATCRAPLEFTF